MTEYNTEPNSHKSRQANEKDERPPKVVEQVATGDVIIKKKTVGRKFRDFVTGAHFGDTFSYVLNDILVPAAKNMVVDGAQEAIEGVVYRGEGRRGSNRYRGGYDRGREQHITYNRPVTRGYARDPRDDPRDRDRDRDRGRRSSRHEVGDPILRSKHEADRILERMRDIVDTYEFASVHDLNEMLGLPKTHVDQKWGWVFLGDAQVIQVREGYLIDLPDPEPIPA